MAGVNYEREHYEREHCIRFIQTATVNNGSIYILINFSFEYNFINRRVVLFYMS